MLWGLKQNLVHTRTQGPHKRLSQTCLWVFECLLLRCRSALACDRDGALTATDLGGTACESHYRATEQTTHRLAVIPEKFLHCCESFRAHKRFPNLVIWQRDWEPPENLTLKPVGFDYRTRETDSWRSETKPCVHQDPEERSSNPTRD